MLRNAILHIRENYTDASNVEQIQAAANYLLEALGPNVAKYPLPVVTVLEKMGFQLFRGTFDNPDQSGIIMVDSSLPEQNKLFETDRAVVVNRNDSVAHQRFTVAHEIAHYIFDYDERTQPTYRKAYLTTEHEDAVEKRANRFAAELLMPADRFVAEYKKCSSAQGNAFSLPSTITHLCKAFGVPAKAVQLRLDETNCMNAEQGA